MNSGELKVRHGVRVLPVIVGNGSDEAQIVIARSSDSESTKFIGGGVESSEVPREEQFRTEAGREFEEETGLAIDPERLISLGIIHEIADGTSSDGLITPGTLMINAWYALLMNEEEELTPHDDIKSLWPVPIAQVTDKLTYKGTRLAYSTSILPQLENLTGE